MFGIFNESGEKMGTFLRAEVKKSGGSVEMRDVCGRYTMDVIASSAFGVDSQMFVDVNSQFAVNGKKLQDNMKLSFMIKFVLAFIFPWMSPYLSISFFNKDATSFLETVVRETIRRRRDLGEKRDDFLQLLLEAQDGQLKEDVVNEGLGLETDGDFEKGARLQNGGKKMEMNEETLIAQCIQFFAAGFDTTETLLVFAAYELALNPEIQEELYQELRETKEKNGGNLTFDAITNMKYLDMVISGLFLS
jgi:cytochrome P450 family 9